MALELPPEADRARRRAGFTASVTEATGIDEAMIGLLVARFYAAARADPLLGPVFAKVHDWDAHIARITDFWSSVILMTGRYHGNPLLAHQPFGLDDAHFARWLSLWSETAEACCPPAAAERFQALAQRIAASLSHSLATSPPPPVALKQFAEKPRQGRRP